MVCISKYKRCNCKFCKKKTRLRAKQDSCKSVLDKFNNGIKRLFYEPPIHKPLLLPIVKVCHKCGSESKVEDDTYIVCEDCEVEKDTCPSKKIYSICLEHIQVSIRYPNT